MHFGVPELLIVLVIVIVLFGGGKIARLGGELGTAVREFRRGLNGGDQNAAKPEETPATPPQTPK